MTLIYPADGNAEQTARDLLSLVADPALVRTNTDNGLAFDVPNATAEEYVALMAGVVPAVDPAPGPDAEPKRRSRTRKEV